MQQLPRLLRWLRFGLKLSFVEALDRSLAHNDFLRLAADSRSNQLGRPTFDPDNK